MYDWLVNHLAKTLRIKVNDSFKSFKNDTLGLFEKGKETLKDKFKNAAEEEDQEQE